MQAGRSGGARGRAGRSLQDVQGMLTRIPQRPQLARLRDDSVQRRDWQVRGNPPGRSRDARTHVPAMGIGLLSDQREVPLGVGVAGHEAGVMAKLLFQPGQLTEPAVVRHDPAVHGERVSVEDRPATRGRPAHVRDERRRLGELRRMREFLVPERWLWLLPVTVS